MKSRFSRVSGWGQGLGRGEFLLGILAASILILPQAAFGSWSPTLLEQNLKDMFTEENGWQENFQSPGDKPLLQWLQGQLDGGGLSVGGVQVKLTGSSPSMKGTFRPEGMKEGAKDVLAIQAGNKSWFYYPPILVTTTDPQTGRKSVHLRPELLVEIDASAQDVAQRVKTYTRVNGQGEAESPAPARVNAGGARRVAAGGVGASGAGAAVSAGRAASRTGGRLAGSAATAAARGLSRAARPGTLTRTVRVNGELKKVELIPYARAPGLYSDREGNTYAARKSTVLAGWQRCGLLGLRRSPVYETRTSIQQVAARGSAPERIQTPGKDGKVLDAGGKVVGRRAAGRPLIIYDGGAGAAPGQRTLYTLDGRRLGRYEDLDLSGAGKRSVLVGGKPQARTLVPFKKAPGYYLDANGNTYAAKTQYVPVTVCCGLFGRRACTSYSPMTRIEQVASAGWTGGAPGRTAPRGNSVPGPAAPRIDG